MIGKEELFHYLIDNSFVSSPSVRELCDALSVKSTSSIYKLLHELESDGLLTITKGKRRNISIKNENTTIKVPLLGTVAAGVPILAQQSIECYINVDDRFRGQELFALRVKGTSMINAGILDGDIIVARRTPTADEGQIVVALIDDEATVKRLYHADGKIELRAENPDFAPIIVDSALVLGIVVANMRYYE